MTDCHLEMYRTKTILRKIFVERGVCVSLITIFLFTNKGLFQDLFGYHNLRKSLFAFMFFCFKFEVVVS